MSGRWRFGRSVGRFLLTTTILYAHPITLQAQDIAVLWDVSQSVMPASQQYAYPQTVRDSVANLVTGQGIKHQEWQISKPIPHVPELESMIEGSGSTASNKRIVVVRFGEFRRSRFPNPPYFAFDQTTTTSGLREWLLSVFPTAAREGLTNKELAMAATARYMFDLGIQQWILITISDFNEDRGVDLTPGERQIIDDFTVNRLVSRSSPAVLRWNQQPSLQVRLEVDGTKGSEKPPAAAPRSRLLENISPANNSKLTTGRLQNFSWKWYDEQPPRNFYLVVTKAGSPAPIIQKQTQSTSFTPDRALPPGAYAWQVFAEAEGGSTASQRSTFSIVSGTTYRSILVLVIIVLFLMCGLWYWNTRRRIPGGSHG